MAKQTLEWHRECFANWTASVERDRAEVARRAAKLADDEKRLAFYAEQIAEASRRGVPFDGDRFLVKRTG